MQLATHWPKPLRFFPQRKTRCHGILSPTPWITVMLAVLGLVSWAAAGPPPAKPVSLIFDTDMGNDVDDALALGVIHALESRGECKLLAVTVTKDHELSGPFVDLVNTFYGRGDVPIGVVRKGPTPEPSKYTTLAQQRDGKQLRYPHKLMRNADAPEATEVLRKALAAQPDQSVVVVQVGFSTNLARLLDSPADSISSMRGSTLVERKVKLLSLMAGAFSSGVSKPHLEYNVIKDIESAKTVARRWPSPVVFSGYEIGMAVPFPAIGIERDFRYVPHHPLAEAYYLYNPPPHNRPNWDLTSVLYAVRPDRGYFGLSPNGRVTVEANGATQFQPDASGRHRYLIITPDQIVRTQEALAQLASQPPSIPPAKPASQP